MATWAGADLAVSVTLAKGLGLIGSAWDLQALDSALQTAPSKLPRFESNNKLPLGVGFLPIFIELEATLRVLEKHQPAVVWLFAAREIDDYALWARGVREKCPGTQIWVQVGSVEAALAVVRGCGPEVLCVQGSDAGGHGFARAAGVVSSLPEVADALRAEGFGGVGLVAAGGIVDGSGVAAALALGAQGVVMGTRFLAAEEVVVEERYRKAVLAARDGGRSTVRCTLFGELSGPSVWPGAYDGRARVSESFTDHEKGMAIEEIRRLHADAVKNEDKGFGVDGKGTAAIWAGTGVGLVKEKQPARVVVEEVRRGAVEATELIRSRLS